MAQHRNSNVHNNPWFGLHMQGELEYTGGGYTRRQAAALVRGEFAHGPDPMPCECGGTAFYRATVGAMQCPDCRELYHCNGEKI